MKPLKFERFIMFPPLAFSAAIHVNSINYLQRDSNKHIDLELGAWGKEIEFLLIAQKQWLSGG